MPALASKIPSYRLHRPSGLGIVCLDGKRIYLGKWNSKESREKYRRVVAEWLANGRRSHGNQPHESIAVVELIDRYLQFAKTYYQRDGQPTKEVLCIKDALRPLFSLYGRTPAIEFGPLSLKAVRGSMIESGWARNTINDRVFRIKRMFRWATENELLPPSVLHGLQAVPGLKRGRSTARETEPVKPVSEHLIQAVQPHVSAEVWAMIQLQVLTAMRPGEVVLMRGCDLDTTGKVWIYSLKRHKTEHHGYDRRIYLGPRAQTIVKPFLQSDLAAYLFCPANAVKAFKQERHSRRKTPLSCGNRPGSTHNPNPTRPPRESYSVDS